MTHEELLTHLRSILEGFEGVPPGECSALPLQLTIEALATFIGGEAEKLACQIDAAYSRLTARTATGVAEATAPLVSDQEPVIYDLFLHVPTRTCYAVRRSGQQVTGCVQLRWALAQHTPLESLDYDGDRSLVEWAEAESQAGNFDLTG